MNDCVVRTGRPLPVSVPVHGEVSARDGGDLAPGLPQPLLQSRDVIESGARGRVPPVREYMDLHVRDSLAPCELEQAEEVALVRMHAPVGKKPQQVKRLSAVAGVRD